MSFQGDVRGIGLAELLQGLARGRKDGVLTLTSRADRRSVIGMEDGQSWLLPDKDESADDWRTRARDAWADDETFTMGAERLEPIVRAGRLETLYSLLDGDGVHFRFDPGVVPSRETKLEEEGHAETELHCNPSPVEFLLLEYARLADEFEMAGHPELVGVGSIPCILDPAELASLPANLVQQCDGTSTIQEISDRLGWPARQAQLAVLTGMNGGGLRLIHPIEALRLALVELQRKQFSRAAARLTLWAQQGTPGPLVAEDAEALANEWLAGRLTAALRRMPPRDVRCLLRRLDNTLDSSAHAVVHWTEATRILPGDRIAKLRLAAMRLREGGEGCGIEVREMLDLAREFREHESVARSGPALAIAAHLQPDAVAQRLELGMGFVQVQRAEEGSPWLISACTDMLAQGHADRVLGPLKSLLEIDPRNREARELLTRASRRSTRSRKARRNMAIATSVVVLMGAGAVVKVKIDEQRQDRIQAIRSLLDEPSTAIAQLDLHFQDDTSLEIGDLRRELEDRLRTVENAQRAAWLDEFHAAQIEAQEGDVIKALEMIRTVPTPPRLKMVTESWPSTVDVMTSMASRLRDEILALGLPSTHAPQQLVVENAVASRTDALRDALSEEEIASEDLKEFRASLDNITALLEERATARSVEKLESERRHILQENDRLLKLAHKSLERSEFERALRHYEEILENDTTGKVRRVLEEEIEKTRTKLEAVQRARRAAGKGRHDKALEILNDTFDETVQVMLPWKVETSPEGVHVEILREGEETPTVRTAPFTIEGTFADSWVLKFHMDDYEGRAIEVRGPQDVAIALSRTPELLFASEGRVDAVPAPVILEGEATTDYILCDRAGTIARIGWNGQDVWRQQIKTVSGIARRPVIRPSQPNSLLFVTETGAVWTVDTADGRLEGPWELGKSPIYGPVVVGEEIHAQLSDGQLARWRASLRPKTDPTDAGKGMLPQTRHGESEGFKVLRATDGGNPFLGFRPTEGEGWSVQVDHDRYIVREEGQDTPAYTVERGGEWTYLAWEAPPSPGDHPILWISDTEGLRAFLPPGVERIGTASTSSPPAPAGVLPEASENASETELEVGPTVGPAPQDDPADGR